MKDNGQIIIYNIPDGKASVALYARVWSVWMNQKQLVELFDTSKQNIGQHIVNILKENELQEKLVVKDYLTTASDGKLYNITFKDKRVLKHKGTISNREMECLVSQVYAEFDGRKKRFEGQQADEVDLQAIEALDQQLKQRGDS